METQFPKKCGCCKTVHTEAAWLALPLKGHGSGLEFRDCACRSTLAILVEEIAEAA